MLLDQRVAKHQQTEENKLRVASDQVTRLIEGLQSMSVSREILDERKTKELRMIENSIALDLNVVRQARKDLEAKADKEGERHITELREELTKVRQFREASHEEYAQEVGEEVRRLDMDLQKETGVRTERGERIAGSLDSEFEQVQKAVD